VSIVANYCKVEQNIKSTNTVPNNIAIPVGTVADTKLLDNKMALEA